MTAAAASQREFAFSLDDFHFIANLVMQKTGIVLAEHKQEMVYGRIARRLRALEITTFSDYCQLLSSEAGDEEIIQFVNAVTTNLTHFFREDHHFSHLAEKVLAPLEENPQRFRIWSAGCSSGMEPHSIAMTAMDAIPSLARMDFRILATDIDTAMLEYGKNGIYPAEELESIPKKMQQKYLRYSKGEPHFQMLEQVQKLISFKHLNLLENWPMKGKFDVIFCRNVVIYFNKETQKKLFDRYADILKPGGWLYIGHSENLSNISSRFELVGRTIYRKVA